MKLNLEELTQEDENPTNEKAKHARFEGVVSLMTVLKIHEKYYFKLFQLCDEGLCL